MKRIFFLIIILTSYSTSAQLYENEYQKAKLYLKSGDSITGLAKIDGDNNLFFKKEKRAKKNKYTYKEVVGLKMFKDDLVKVFKYKLVVSVGPLLLRVENQENSKMKLYSQSHYGVNSVPGNFQGGTYTPGFSTGEIIEVKRYFINKKNSNHSVIKIWSDTNGRKDKVFRNRIVKYFKDCKSLVKKIKNKEYRRFQIYEIVDFYNFNCLD